MWLRSAIWVNPARVTTVMVPMHIGTGVIKPTAAGTEAVLTILLAEICSHADNPGDWK